MSTRGIIARPDPLHGWVGRYHHWDSYPHGLGRALWSALHGPFEGDLRALLRVLLDEHPAGWSTIVNADWNLEPGYVSGPNEADDHRPQCYCHGARHEPPQPWATPGADWGAEWVYVLDAIARTMTVYEAIDADGAPAIGMWGVNPARLAWKEIAVIPLDGPEPDWTALQ